MENNLVDVYIEIAANSSIKYELEESTGRLVVDRFLPTPMAYPENYGMVAKTKAPDNDPLDIVVFSAQPIMPGAWIKAKIIGMMVMKDEKGRDTKILAVPANINIDPEHGKWEDMADIPEARLKRLEHFFMHYKDLEKEKWVKLEGTYGREKALEELTNCLI